MKKMLITIVLAGVLSGCATTGEGPGSREDFIRNVQAITSSLCSFVPVASTITAIFTAGQYTGAFAIATAICEALQSVPPPQARAKGAKAPTPRVSGVPIRGYYLKGR